MNDISYDMIDYGYAYDEGYVEIPPRRYSLFIAAWLSICALGLLLIVFLKSTIIGGAIIGVATFIAMVTRPAFALCIFLLILPTGSGVGVEGVFSLGKMVGLALGGSYLVHMLICNPQLKIRHKAPWMYVLYSVWIFSSMIWGAYFNEEFIIFLTQLQMLFLVFIAYWITQNLERHEFIMILRSYVIGVSGMLLYGVLSGHGASVTQTAEGLRYSATIGRGIDANMFAVIVGLGLLTAIYLFFREKKMLHKFVYMLVIGFLPIMMLQIGSRGGIIALGASVLLTWLSLKNLIKRPILIVGIIFIGIVAAFFMVKFFERSRIQDKVAQRITDKGMMGEAMGYRMEMNRIAVRSAFNMPQGTSRSGWFVWTGATSWPHNDFFYCLGVYGFPGVSFFTLFIASVCIAVFKIHIGLEQIYARSILIFLLVSGLVLTQIWTKHYWIFLVLVLALNRVSLLFDDSNNNIQEYLTDEGIDCQSYVS